MNAPTPVTGSSSRELVLNLLEELKLCDSSRYLQRVKHLHSQARCSGLLSATHVVSRLISRYAKCGSMHDARKLFDTLLRPNVACWNSMIQGYVDNGEFELALSTFDALKSCHSCSPDPRIFVAALNACAALGARQVDSTRRWLEKGKELHSEASRRRCCDNIFVQCSLLDMYGKCGCMRDARSVFEKMIQRNVVAWTSLLKGYVENGESEVALELLSRMESERRCSPNARTYVVALTACGCLAQKQTTDAGKLVERAQEIYLRALENGCSDIFVETTMVDLLASCGRMIHSRNIFEKMKHRNVVTWTALLQGYVQNGENELALELFERMHEETRPNERTYVAALSACAALAGKQSSSRRPWLEKGKGIYIEAVENHCSENVFVQNAMIDLYGKSGEVEQARAVFESIPSRTSLVWNTLMKLYVENDEPELALELFDEMEAPDARACIIALGACATLGTKGNSISRKWWLKRVEIIHLRAQKQKLGDELVLQNTLVDVYAQLGSMQLAQKVFDGVIHRDLVSWNALMQGYAENGGSEQTLELFCRIQDESHCVPNARTFVAAFTACSNLIVSAGPDDAHQKKRWLEVGKCIHSVALRSSSYDVFVETSLISFYSKSGDVLRGGIVFASITQPTLVSWNALLHGYVDNGENKLALENFRVMELRNSMTYVAALSALGNLTALEAGRKIHLKIQGLAKDALVASCLVDFYSKCGSMGEAKQVFDSIEMKNTSCWNALMGGFSRSCESHKVFEVFEKMVEQGIAPDERTCTLVLAACSHSGLVEKAKEFFDEMPRRYKISPNVIHYNCMVDLLGRANQVEEARQFASDAPMGGNEVSWTTIAGASSLNSVESRTSSV